MAETTIFITEGASVEAIQHIEQLLNGVEGIERVLTDTNDGEIKVEFDDQKTSRDSIIKTLEKSDWTSM